MIFGAKSAICKILQCIKVAATAICLLGAFSDIALTLACASGDFEKVIRLLVLYGSNSASCQRSFATALGIFIS
jgi:hypothetical protein